jgi:hypothetical protein
LEFGVVFGHELQGLGYGGDRGGGSLDFFGDFGQGMLTLGLVAISEPLDQELDLFFEELILF